MPIFQTELTRPQSLIRWRAPEEGIYCPAPVPVLLAFYDGVIDTGRIEFSDGNVRFTSNDNDLTDNVAYWAHYPDSPIAAPACEPR